MECNKEDALQAKRVAEKKLESKDYVGAHKMILKAQKLFPDLENILQIMTVCRVHCAAEIKFQGSEMDWYGILQVEMVADKASIKKQYRKLALLLHPDKNKFPGAESAFKLIGEAMRILSDQSMRAAFDLNRKHAMTKPGIPTKPAQPNHSFAARKFTGFPNNFMSHSAPQSSGTNKPHKRQYPPSTGATTFWTMCPFCSISYQYYIHTMNSFLKCQNCMRTFIALDINISDTQFRSETTHSRSSYSEQNGNTNTGVNFGPHRIPQSGISRSNSYGMGFQQNVSGVSVQMRTDEVKCAERRYNFEAEEVDGVERPADMEKQFVDKSATKNLRKVGSESSGSDTAESEVSEVIEAVDIGAQSCSQQQTGPDTQRQRKSSRNKKHVSYNEGDSDEDDFVNAPHSKRLKRTESSQDEGKCRKDSAQHVKSSLEDPTSNPSEDSNDKKSNNALCKEENRFNSKNLEINNANSSESSYIGEKQEDNGKSDSRSDEDGESSSVPNILECPDQEFHDFDGDKTGSHFMSDQVWAVYDEVDALPRFYAIVRKVLSTDFKLRITWLESSSPHEAEQEWVAAELPIACGRYSLGKTMVTEDRLMFSHLMKCERACESGRKYYKIYPRKGEIWALYKDWDINWSTNPENHKKFTYELVEIIDDYADDTGVDVVLLIKMRGFQSLFTRMVSKGSEVIVHISGCDLCKFSHQVPAHIMEGGEKEGVPRDSLELDLAALPSNFEASVPAKNCSEVRESGLKNNQADSTAFDPATEHKEFFFGPRKPIPSGMKDEQERKGAQRNDYVNCNFSNVGNVNGVSAKKPKQTNADKRYLDETAKVGTRFAPRSPKSISGIYVEQPKLTVASGHNSLSTISIGHGNSQAHSDNDAGKNHVFVGFEGLNPLHASSLGADVYACSSPKFHDFMNDRSIDKFRRNQIWAMYDDKFDKKPRLYALIQKVDLSAKKLYFTRLTVCGDLKWLSQGLPIPCGMFRADKSDSCGPHIFSHQLRDDPTWKLGIYRIYPRQGEVWALYTNYKLEWSCSEFERRGYSIVEVLTNYNAEKGVIIHRMSKVRGQSSVFKNSGKQENIQSKDVLIFSHQIPSFRITDETGLSGCWELDDACLPSSAHTSKFQFFEL